MAEKGKAKLPGKGQADSHQVTLKPSEVVKVEFVITTYPELRPFLEMAVLLLEGVYESKNPGTS